MENLDHGTRRIAQRPERPFASSLPIVIVCRHIEDHADKHH